MEEMEDQRIEPYLNELPPDDPPGVEILTQMRPFPTYWGMIRNCWRMTINLIFSNSQTVRFPLTITSQEAGDLEPSPHQGTQHEPSALPCTTRTGLKIFQHVSEIFKLPKELDMHTVESSKLNILLSFCKCGCLYIIFTCSVYVCTASVLREILCVAWTLWLCILAEMIFG